MKLATVLVILAVVPQTAAEEQPTAGSVATPASAELAQAPQAVACYDVAEFVVNVTHPPFQNPFTQAELVGVFRAADGPAVTIAGFADADDGSVFRLRFCPQQAGAVYRYEIKLSGGGLVRQFTGDLRCTPSDRPGPVIVDPQHPKHFIYAGAKRPFYHLGYTAYHLLDPSRGQADVDATIDYCARHGFNKVRFLLSGYPRDMDHRTPEGDSPISAARTSGQSPDPEYGVADPWKAPNYGAKPGRVNPLPAWPGKPHAYDFTRMNLAHWRRAEYAVRRMRERGIVATCIFTIEKQDLPKEYGRLSPQERLLYRYAIARLAAFDNVWWDLGNEHNEFRDRGWGDAMGAFVKEIDPYDRLASAHGYAEFWYGKSPWADFIITQQYGDEKKVHEWALGFRDLPKPYVNEEYGYEGARDVPGHAQNADWVRRCHWSIAMAGGYATYGDWSDGVSYFYMGDHGPGKAAAQLRHLWGFFESLPLVELVPHDELTTAGFCLARPPQHYVFYLPHGGQAEIRLETKPGRKPIARWFDPRTGQWQGGPALSGGSNTVVAPDDRDWVLGVRSE